MTHRDCSFHWLDDQQAHAAAAYARGLGYTSPGPLARVLYLRAMKQYPLSGRRKARGEESCGDPAGGPSGVLLDGSTGNELER